MNELQFYLPGTADNLQFFTLVVLVLLMITGIYGSLSNQLKKDVATSPKRQWGWPSFSLAALAILFLWFGQPISEGTTSNFSEFVILISPFVMGMTVIASGAVAVLSSDLKRAISAATISFLSSGLLFLQADVLPLVLLFWLTLGGTVLLFLNQGSSNNKKDIEHNDSEQPFQEPFLACLVCGLLLCCCLWVVHREWTSTSTQTTTTWSTSTSATHVEGADLAKLFLMENWPIFLLLLVFVAVSFTGVSHLIATPYDSPRFSQQNQREVH